ncbi:MAG: MFS transporter [Rhodospirillaceae bacterium]|nr:MFS transporter [Rhodospirillaceae bacterium]
MVPAAESSRVNGTIAALGVFLERRTLVMLALGFSAGLPFLLIFDTLSAWLREAGLSLEVIGFFSLATIAYAFKFLWAPWVDRTKVPVLTQLLGHRRSWMLVAQGAVIAGLWLIAGTDPASNLGLMALFAVITGFSSATQDIVIDAWRIEAVGEERQGAMVAAYTWGYRAARIVAGAAPLILAQLYTWSLSYAVMGALMAVGILAVLFAPREREHVVRPIPDGGLPSRPWTERFEWLLRLMVLVTGALVLGSGLSGKADAVASVLPAAVAEPLKAIWTAPGSGVWIQLLGVLVGGALIAVAAWPLRGRPTRPGALLSHAFGDPLADFFGRYRGTAALILALICLYRLADFTLNIMNPFYIDLGFTLTEIAEVRKLYGTAMSMIGVFAGGYAIARWGLMGPLLVGALIGPISNLVFAWLATQGPDLFALTVAISIDNISEGFSGTCLIAYMSSLTAEGFTATQYALFSSLYAIPGKLAGSQSGRIVEAAARSVDGGGPFASLTSLFAHLPAGSLAQGAAKLGVAPAALGAGYVVFFVYTFVAGLSGILLTWLVVHRTKSKEKP